MHDTLYTTRQIAPGMWQITDALDDRAYLLVGERAAVLVDTCIGYGDLRAVVCELTDLPITILLTHFHYDHVGGAYFFGGGAHDGTEPSQVAEFARTEEPARADATQTTPVFIAADDDGRWDFELARAQRVYDQVVDQGVFDRGVPFGSRDGVFPDVRHVEEGAVFDLGGLTVEAVALPGHTAGSMGYLVRERRVLLSGDAVTPIMCLCFEGHLGIDEYRATLAKMAELPFDTFYTGHHDVAFLREDLPSFDACAEYAQSHRGVAWRHMQLPEYMGTAYLPPCKTIDADSPDFRALIGPYVPRPRKRRRSPTLS